MVERYLYFIYGKNKYKFINKITFFKNSLISFTSILNKKSSELCFIYNGKILSINNNNLNKLSLKNINRDINIFVFDTFKKRNNLINDIICPKCKNFGIIEINKDKISINDCIKGHNIKDLSFKDFLESQYIDEKYINCSECGNSKRLYGDNFYICSCEKNLCQLCISKHGKHTQIFYNNKYFQCYNHGINYISYCKICKKNLCKTCESEHSVQYPKHKITLYKEKILNENEINLIKGKIENDNIKINKFRSQLSKTELIFNEIFKYLKKNIEGYFEFNSKILKCSQAFNNYESIITFENYYKNKNNLFILKEINDYFQKDNKNRLQFIVDLYEKTFNNKMTLIYKNDDGEIKLF